MIMEVPRVIENFFFPGSFLTCNKPRCFTTSSGAITLVLIELLSASIFTSKRKSFGSDFLLSRYRFPYLPGVAWWDVLLVPDLYRCILLTD